MVERTTIHLFCFQQLCDNLGSCDVFDIAAHRRELRRELHDVPVELKHSFRRCGLEVALGPVCMQSTIERINLPEQEVGFKYKSTSSFSSAAGTSGSGINAAGNNGISRDGAPTLGGVRFKHKNQLIRSSDELIRSSDELIRSSDELIRSSDELIKFAEILK